jgi:hypothetical protein
MAIRDHIPTISTAGALATHRAKSPEGAALWQRFSARSADDAAADRETAISRTLASSSNPTLLHEHLRAN